MAGHQQRTRIPAITRAAATLAVAALALLPLTGAPTTATPRTLAGQSTGHSDTEEWNGTGAWCTSCIK